MAKEVNLIARRSAWRRFKGAPRILRAYVIFALLASLLAVTPLWSRSLNEAIVPYAGWSGFAIYMFTLFFAITASLSPQRKSVNAVVSLLLLGVVLGIVDTVRHYWGPSNDFGNPYLAYHMYRPVVTIILPAVWIVLLMSPLMRKWTNGTIEISESNT